VKSLRKAYRGEKGFTLVELLVVVVILGVLAAVAVLAVTRFMGEGRLEAAQTELHQAQTAIAAAMSEAGVASVTDDGGDMLFGPGNDFIAGTTASGTATSSQQFLHGPLTATYTVDTSGNIVDANDDATPPPFGDGICWDLGDLQWTDDCP
jgi:prepilin-type N-terminal cleavage/methylation domain-containing protein